MARISVQFCYCCNKEFKVFQQGGKQQIYCSNSCKQKAYRARKQQAREAEKRMLTMEAWNVQNWIVTTYGDIADYHLGAFFNVHGKEAYQDMLAVIRQIVGVNQ